MSRRISGVDDVFKGFTTGRKGGAGVPGSGLRRRGLAWKRLMAHRRVGSAVLDWFNKWSDTCESTQRLAEKPKSIGYGADSQMHWRQMLARVAIQFSWQSLGIPGENYDLRFRGCLVGDKEDEISPRDASGFRGREYAVITFGVSRASRYLVFWGGGSVRIPGRNVFGATVMGMHRGDEDQVSCSRESSAFPGEKQGAVIPP
ncbi:hypothetical protein DFH09DRAFT_1069407 [Mycena vulgaris]|nr:hypothetical protein DFH09DRAFT_1069407 [Mycena vulgaris]